jgi:flagellin
LLDGSLDFITDINTLTSVVDSKIDQANLGATGSMTVDISVQAQATQAQLVNTAFPLTNATATLDFPVRATNVLTDISVSASEITDAVTIVFQHSASVAADEVQAEYDPDTNTITVSGNEAVLGTITKAQVTSAINALPEFTAQVGVGAALDPAGDFTLGGSPPGNATLAESAIDIEADQPGLSFNQVDIVLQVGAATGAAYDTANKRLTITYVAGTDDIADIASAIDATAEFSVTSTSGGTAITSALDAQVEGNTDFTGGGVLLDHVVFELQGSLGAETFNFQAGTSNLHIAAAINQVSDATGVTAEVDATSGDIELYSSTWGSKSLVAINIITEGPLGTFRDNLSGIRDTGTDIVARVNGIGADGDGNQLSINTSTLSLQLTLDPDQAVNALSFSITGGGALFQLGGDVVTNQQARMGIGSMSTSTLGGPSGRLYELGSGQDKSLTRDMYGASRVIQEVINKVTGLRGRLGAFQATTLDSNMVSLTDTVGNLTEAESLIRDADFAKETARLTRAQILIQSGTAVLGISNQNPQNVLRLLQ